MSNVDTVLNEANAFMDRHKNLNETHSVIGGIAYGFMRALAECPECPGVFRIPNNENWDHLYCPSCGGIWTHKSIIQSEDKV